MGRAIAVRADYTSGEVRRVAQRVKNAAQARRLLAIAAVLDGASREDAAKIGGMDRQTLRDWVIRFNEQGPEGLINHRSRAVIKNTVCRFANLRILSGSCWYSWVDSNHRPPAATARLRRPSRAGRCGITPRCKLHIAQFTFWSYAGRSTDTDTGK
jgi:hypothetical protein